MRLIDGDALKQHTHWEHIPGEYHLVVEWSYIRDAPTVDATPVVRGYWIRIMDTDLCTEYDVFSHGGYRCSMCSETNYSGLPTEYCPRCGAKMEDM